jgi:hypothetical protein
MATSRTKKRSKKVDDTPEVTATAPLDEDTSPPTDPAPETPPAPEPPPEPKPEPEPPKKKGKKAKRPPEPTEWVVKVDGKKVGEIYPNKMAAIRAGMALNADGKVTVDPA